jgi:hypothetical protein
MTDAGVSSARIQEYWSWIAVSLFLLISVDMLTTIFAAAALGSDAEANPLMRWALEQGVGTLVAVNLAAVVLAVGFFYALLELLAQTPARYQRGFALLVEVYLGILLFAGLGVLANNLSAVILGASILPV